MSETRRRALAVPAPPGTSPLVPEFVLYDEVQAGFRSDFGSLQPVVSGNQGGIDYTYREDSVSGKRIALTADGQVYVQDAPAPGGAQRPAPQPVGNLDQLCLQPDLARYCGFKLRRVVRPQDVDRHYIVYVPWAARNASNVPVVFMLHGTSGTGDEFYDRSGWREAADRYGHIAVFPTALRHCFYEANQRKTPTKWAFGGLGDPTNLPLCSPSDRALLAETDHELADDVRFFDIMVDDLRANFGVDRRRIYVAGFSAGGQMAARLASERSSVIAAVAASGGWAWEGLTPATRAIPVLYTVGENDDRYTTRYGAPSLPLGDTGADARFQLFFPQPFTRFLGLDETRYSFGRVPINNVAVSLYSYTTPLAGAGVHGVLYMGLMPGIDHNYPTSSNSWIDLPTITWEEFFSRYALP